MRTRWLGLLVLGAVVGIAVTDTESGTSMWLRLQGDVAEASGRVDALVRENSDLKAQIDALESDPFALERAIREDLELARSGEIVVRFDRPMRRDW